MKNIFKDHIDYFREFEKHQVEVSPLTVFPTALKALSTFCWFHFSDFLFIFNSFFVDFTLYIFLSFYFQLQTFPRYILSLPTQLYGFFNLWKIEKKIATIKYNINLRPQNMRPAWTVCEI